MIGFDVLLMASQLLLTVGPLVILSNSLSYVPRRSSLLLVVGLIGMTVALVGLQAPLGASATALGAAAWFAVFLLRGVKTR